MRVYARIMSMICYAARARMIARRLTGLYDEALAPLGINVVQYSHLRTVSRLQPVSLTTLAGALELDRSTVGRNAKQLATMGLLASATGEDQRENTLTLSAEGERVLAQAIPRWQALQDKLDQRMGDRRVDEALSLLQDI